MLFPLENICWICLKPVPPETMPDEFGFFTHEACCNRQRERSTQTWQENLTPHFAVV
jgi:hypothetical protein